MKFAIFGAGAIGGVLASLLADAGHEVHLLARGANLQALRAEGLLVRSKVFGDRRHKLPASADPNEVGPSDYVILAMKAGSLPGAARNVAPLKGAATTFVSLQNGMPWWYFHGIDGDEQPIEAVDPGGTVTRNIPPEQCLGAIAYISSSMPAPGVVEHTSGARLPLGEPSGKRTQRCLQLAAALRSAGIKAPVRANIRHELWVKLMGNAAFNPLSALTRATLSELTASPHGVRVIGSIMDEVREVAAAAGVQIALSNERRIAGARAVGSHKTSMLQDLERGRQHELDALLGAVIELADRWHVAVPAIRAVDAAARVAFECGTSGSEPTS